MKLHLAADGAPYATHIDTDETVVITDAFIGPIITNKEGVCVSIFQRDDGFEMNVWRQQEGTSIGANELLPKGALQIAVHPERGVRFLSNHEPQANLGIATNEELEQEMEARLRMGNTHPQYSTVNGAPPWRPDFGVDGPPELAQDRIRSAIFQAVGASSMCWEGIERAGVFKNDMASWVAEGLLEYLHIDDGL